MAAACMQGAADLKLVEGLLTSVDCSISDVVTSGYGAMMGPGSQLIAILTALLTIYIAVLGMRIMLGMGSLRIGDLTVIAVKIGVVLALATNWPLYHQLIFTTLFSGPEQFAGQLLNGASDGQGGGFLHGQLQLAYDELQASAVYYGQRSAGSAAPLVGGAPLGAASLNLSSILMLVSTLGVLLGAKIVLATLLVLGPLFIGFVLFDATRGLFLGWLRAAVGLALAPVMALLALVVEISLLQPHLVRLARVRTQPVAELEPAIAVLIVVLTVTMVTLAGLIAVGVVAFSLRLPSRSGAQGKSRETQVVRGGDLQIVSGRAAGIEAQPRIASVAAAANALERRDSRLMVATSAGRIDRSGGGSAPSFTPETATPLGRSHRRSAQPRQAASSMRRDR